MIRIILFSIISLLVTSCDDGSNPILPEPSFLNIYLEDDLDENGYYHVNYNDMNYHSVDYQTLPNERVFWTSPNEFSIDWMWQEFEQPIVSYSTYADEIGIGQQLFYIDETMVGDTLMIFGYVNELAWDYLYFIVEQPVLASECSNGAAPPGFPDGFTCVDYMEGCDIFQVDEILVCGLDGVTYCNVCVAECINGPGMWTWGACE